jgi:PAS fold
MRLIDSSATWPPEGGAMAEAIRKTNWALTPLGPSHHWPAALRIAVTTALDSPLPIVVLWGPELFQIYNDAYRPILGLRHPAAMGQPTSDCWPEVWGFNQPIYQQVMGNGRPVHLEDQAYVIEPSGVPETRYFTVTYAPLRDEDGMVGGVTVIAVETTQRVLMAHENQALLQATRFAVDQLTQMFEQAPNFMMVLKGPNHVFEIVNAAGRMMFLNRDVIGKSVLQALPEVEAQGFVKLLDGVYQSGETFLASNKLISFATPDAPPDAALIDRYVDFVYQPIKDAQGRVSGIFVSGSDVTEHHYARLDLSANLQRLRAAEARQAFQLTLADHLRPLASPEEVTAAACE